jgi:hypothetical protein
VDVNVEDEIELMFAEFRMRQEDEPWLIYGADGSTRRAQRNRSRWPGGAWQFRPR